LKEEVEVAFERKVIPFGSSAKVDVPERCLRWRAYMIVVRDFVQKSKKSLKLYETVCLAKFRPLRCV